MARSSSNKAMFDHARGEIVNPLPTRMTMYSVYSVPDTYPRYEMSYGSAADDTIMALYSLSDMLTVTMLPASTENGPDPPPSYRAPTRPSKLP